MSLTDIARQIERYTIDNSPAIMTGIGVVGTISTAYLTGKASSEATRMIQREERRLNAGGKNPRVDLDYWEKVKLTWVEFLPAVISGAVTVGSIVGANRVNSKRYAAIAAAYSLSERAYSEYKEKVVKTLSEKKEQKYRDEISQDRVDSHPASSATVIAGSGTVLCCDSMSMRYFMSDMETIRKAQNDLNDTILRYDHACLSDFYDNLGLPKTALSDEVGWNTDDLLTLQFTTAMSDDNRPCIYIEYRTKPIRKFHQLQ